RAEMPAASAAGWEQNAIDAFLLAAMKAKEVTPAPPAGRRVLIRRAYLDVLGLPPSPDQVEAFLHDLAPDAWERLVDQLLASPHYGERWARHWLDLVRYADSGGFEFDVDRPEAWRYRDYVVRAFNGDKPYDRFVREQVAGDEIAQPAAGNPAPQSDEALIATGFLRLGPESGGGPRGQQESLDDLIATTCLTFLGLTANCARCHDHKFDPIPQVDYYRLQAVFAPLRSISHPLVGPEAREANRAESARLEAALRPLRREKSRLEAPYLERLIADAIRQMPEYLQTAWNTPADQRTEGQRLNVAQIKRTLESDTLRNKFPEQSLVALMIEDEKQRHAELKSEIAALEKEKPKPSPAAMAVGESSAAPRPTYFLHRGSADARGPAVTPGVLSVLSERDYAFPAPPAGARSSWRRTGLADWIASPENPLTARVMANRLWQHHFGEGLVRTPSNFGDLGERPSHPELLDWLALEFIRAGWSTKALHRLMLTSQAYQMASDDSVAGLAADPENRLLWRMPRQRLEAEAIRDQVLAVAGTLDHAVGGPCVFPYIDPVLFQSSTKRTWPGRPVDDASTLRRSIYVYSKRSIRYPLFEAFDQPNLVNSHDRRNRSTIAPQALLLMNNSLLTAQAGQFADRLRREAGTGAADQVERAYLLALGRPPDDFERARSLEFVQTSPDALAEFCLALFNLNEFVYRP
ncbi:MAG TPA: DUF1549 and DUF1553 domain-containing protein, partial [Pirellulaceae bacterium]|nr:DUF1549 and DUF1553 domain-containing protein [Pirellulaceae bacterium]